MKTKIIAFTGPMFSGKSTAASMLTTLISDCIIQKFAQPIYDVAQHAANAAGHSFEKDKMRGFMQFYGAYMRDVYGEDTWVDTWELNYKRFSFFSSTPPFQTLPTVIIDDLRYDNEARRIKELGGKIIRMQPEESIRAKRGIITNPTHKSELGIESKYIDATVYNNGSKEDLYKNLSYLIESL